MDFRLDEEQQMLKDAIHRFAAERVRKVFREADEDGHLPAELIQAGWEIGVLPTSVPEDFGGFGEHSVVTNAIALEEFAWGDLATALRINAPALLAIPVMLSGTDNQKEQFLPLVCDEAAPGLTAALTEPVIQFNSRQLDTTAVRDGDNYTLNGKKMAVPHADSADTILVYANEAGTTQAFLVPADSAGLTIGDREKLMGLRALPTFTITLENVTIPAANRLGGDAGCNIDLIMAHHQVAAGAAAVGMTRGALEYALAYAKERKQFGEPIAYRQSIAFMLAEMAIDIDAARLMVWEAAWRLDQGKDAVRQASIMKYFVDDMVMKVSDRALQTLGGYGYIREYPVELWFRNARGFVSLDGLAIV